MRSTYEARVAEQTEIQGQLLSGRDKIVPPPYWTEFARIIWPNKTAEQLAAIADADPRTAKRWLSGEYEPPVVVVLAIMNKMFERRE